MSTFIQITFSGLATGAIFALAAVGFALLWQTAGAINFAHGEFIVAPGGDHGHPRRGRNR